MLETLNDLTGLLVSTFQGESTGTSFVVDGARGREFGQKERKPRPTLPREPTAKDFPWCAVRCNRRQPGTTGVESARRELGDESRGPGPVALEHAHREERAQRIVGRA